MDLSPNGQSGRREFLSDLKLALRSWSEAPLLPLMSMAVAGAATLGGQALKEEIGNPIGALVSILWLGWFGAERIWYLRIFRGLPFGPGEALRAGVKMILPFFFLGLLVFYVTLPALGLALLSTAWEDVPAWLASVAYGIVVDVVATFMTPAIAYSTREASEARKIGWEMLKQTWPHCAWYALVPPVAIVVSLQIAEIDPGLRLTFTLAATLIALLFKGATAAYYLRRHPDVGDYGWLRQAEPRVA